MLTGMAPVSSVRVRAWQNMQRLKSLSSFIAVLPLAGPRMDRSWASEGLSWEAAEGAPLQLNIVSRLDCGEHSGATVEHIRAAHEIIGRHKRIVQAAHFGHREELGRDARQLDTHVSRFGADDKADGFAFGREETQTSAVRRTRRGFPAAAFR